MNVADFIARGVTFETIAGVTHATGPSGDADLLEALRGAVRERMPAIERDERRVRSRWAETCIFCGADMGPWRSGDCALCRIAIGKVNKP